MNVLTELHEYGVGRIDRIDPMVMAEFFSDMFEGPGREVLKRIGTRSEEDAETMNIEMEDIVFLVAFYCGKHGYRNFDTYRYSSAVRVTLILMIEGALRIKSPKMIFDTAVDDTVSVMKRYSECFV